MILYTYDILTGYKITQKSWRLSKIPSKHKNNISYIMNFILSMVEHKHKLKNNQTIYIKDVWVI